MSQLSLFEELASEREGRLREERATLCLDCDVDTIAINEFYVVHDSIWAIVNPASAGMLCIGCLEHRLGRELHRDDFADVPGNAWVWKKSSRLERRFRRRAHGSDDAQTGSTHETWTAEP